MELEPLENTRADEIAHTYVESVRGSAMAMLLNRIIVFEAGAAQLSWPGAELYAL